jgi:CRP-like cAMP-binding protein
MKDSILFNGFSDEEFNAVTSAPYFVAESYNAGVHLLDEGDLVKRFWFLEDGTLHASRAYYDGSLDLVQLYSANDYPGLDIVFTKTQRSPLRISAATDATLTSIDVGIFSDRKLDSVIREKFTLNALRLLANENIRKQVKIDVLYKRSLRARICVFLSHMRERYDSDAFEISMNREQLSQFLGVNRSALSKELSRMREEGLIECRKGRFKILDPTLGEGL